MLSVIGFLVVSTLALTTGQVSWDRINSNAIDISAKGTNLVTLTPDHMILTWSGGKWVVVGYNNDIFHKISVGVDGFIYAIGDRNHLFRYDPNAKSWTEVFTTGDMATINAKDATTIVAINIRYGNVAKYAGVWGYIGANNDAGGYTNRAVAIGTDGAIFKIDQLGVLTKFDGTNTFNVVTLDPNIGEPVQLDVHSATRLVVLDYTQTPFLYNGNSWTNLGGGFPCLRVTLNATTVFCLDAHGCVRSTVA